MCNKNLTDCGTGMQRLMMIAVACALAGACAHEATTTQPAPAEATITAPAAIAPAPSSSPPSAAAPQAPSVATPPPVAAAAPAAAAGASTPPAGTAAQAPKSAAAPAKTPAAAKPAPAPSAATAAGAAVAAVPAAAAAPAAGTLDLPLLEQRLKDTRAIGVFTKLSLKNQVDDLLKQFRAYHKGGSPQTLPKLRQSYEVLLLKVVSLLQDDDPKLAAAVGSSREAIWGVLVDPKKFASLDA
jgi:hypothetical protein